MKKSLRARVLAGEVVFGTFVAIPHPVAAEICAMNGLDMVCIDWEHSQLDRGRLEDMIRACDVHGTPTLVRVPGGQPEWIAAALDSGAAGILAPRVSSAEEARRVVEATRCPPIGRRGIGPGRASGYGRDIAGHVDAANNSLLLAVQVETVEGLRNIEEIAAVEGVDLIFVGPGDLAVSMGATGSSDTGRVSSAIDEIVAPALAARRSAGLYRPNGDDVDEWLSKGVNVFIVGSDTALLSAALRETVSSMTAVHRPRTVSRVRA